MNELVQKLSKGRHEVVIGYKNETYEEIKKRVEEGYIHIKFTKTKGETELGINIKNTNIKEIDFNQLTGLLHITGTTNLNYNTVACIFDIDLATMKGMGHLEIV